MSAPLWEKHIGVFTSTNSERDFVSLFLFLEIYVCFVQVGIIIMKI